LMFEIFLSGEDPQPIRWYHENLLKIL